MTNHPPVASCRRAAASEAAIGPTRRMGTTRPPRRPRTARAGRGRPSSQPARRVHHTPRAGRGESGGTGQTARHEFRVQTLTAAVLRYVYLKREHGNKVHPNCVPWKRKKVCAPCRHVRQRCVRRYVVIVYMFYDLLWYGIYRIYCPHISYCIYRSMGHGPTAVADKSIL